jgi:single-strand DNA-binding protein
MNNVSFTGNAGRDPEVRYFESGTSVANFTVAIYTGKDKPPVWVPVSAWGKSSEIAVDRIRKGSKVGIEGRLHMEEWTDRTSGEKRNKLCVVANRLEVFDRADSAGAGAASSGGFGGDPSEEEVPF